MKILDFSGKTALITGAAGAIGKAVAQQLIEDGATVVITDLKSGKTGSALMSHYCAAKGAIISFTQALAYELADYNINVNCVCPDITDNSGVWTNVSAGYTVNLQMPKDEVVKKFTAKIPLKRLATVQDVAAVTASLASAGADYMTGQSVNITGGRECINL
ncbi:MAG: SDR family oxidoreductase [Prevotellaceae bacterium]|jgi:NAD(P)-dependent dehydrogenase (short-subunit alcohol dehydrogenase family)|nr:SDR family oxidoreductase [Prevotellaceae bacterium]